VTFPEILYQDDEIFVIDKPAGLAVQGGAKIVHSVDALLAASTGAKVFPVHRLDKDTAGILVVAKTAAAAAQWTARMASPEVTKEYLALCVGRPPESAGTFTQTVGLPPKSASTAYRVLDTAALSGPEPDIPPEVSLLSLTLGTGRTHQIRIHLAQARCPVAGDDKYGDFKVNRALRKHWGIKKLQLAAMRLTLPLGGASRNFAILAPPHFRTDLFKKGLAGAS
jgi:23S rRNA pseudouridine955/2504/2580 synthase